MINKKIVPKERTYIKIRECSNCKYKSRRSLSQPCWFCIKGGYGSHPLWEDEVDNE